MSARPWATGGLLCVALVVLLPRVTNLGTFLSPDEPRWYENTLGFREGILTGNLRKLYQQPHPGITTMWLSWPTIESSSWMVRKLPHAVGVAILIVLGAWLSARLWGTGIGVAIGLLLAINPIAIAHARVLAMDALLGGFLLTSVLALLLWRTEHRVQWLAISGALCALAVLSKLAGAVIVPFALLVILGIGLKRKLSPQQLLRALAWWIGTAVVTAIVVFPTVLVYPSMIFAELRTFFLTEHYQGAVHALGPRWYAETLLLWTTPLHLFALLGVPFVFRSFSGRRADVSLLAAFAALFFTAMQVSVKKGDRYLLPDFLFFDVLAVLLLTALLAAFAQRRPFQLAALAGITALVAWQGVTIIKLHPYELAYRNPFFRKVALHRPMGWGEGLDLAAEYLNAKPDSEKFLVASYYEGPFSYRFKGEVTSAERLAKETPEEVGAKYVVLYRAMVGRAPDRWETKVLKQFTDKQPEKVIKINGEEYVWIYRITSPSARSTTEMPSGSKVFSGGRRARRGARP